MLFSVICYKNRARGLFRFSFSSLLEKRLYGPIKTLLAIPVDLLHNVGMKLENHIPVPGPQAARERYPFPQMQVGDSFMILDETWIKNLRSAAYMFSRRHPGVKFTVRRYGEGWRLWRVA